MSERELLVRRWASGVVHMATVPEPLVESATVFGAEACVISVPIVTYCGALLRADGLTYGGLIIVMRPDTKKVCRQCRRWAAAQGSPVQEVVP